VSARRPGRRDLREVRLEPDTPTEGYPFDLPAVGALPLRVGAGVTVLVGENGSGKSTLIEAIAVAAGFNPEGGSFQARFSSSCGAASSTRPNGSHATSADLRHPAMAGVAR
jgi:predicted ATPase